MKLNSKRDKRNYIIIALCMILVVMGVGYAAFLSLLTINGTANISNSWCVGFDNSKTNAYEITKGVSTGEAPTGTMTYSGDVCSTNLVPHSNLTAVFHQPGDQIEYTLTIKNASTVTAAIKSIKVDNQNITGNTTKTKGNITFTINFPLDTTLSPNEQTTMTIIAKFQNETDVTGSFTGSESQTISVELNGEQDDGNGGIVPTPSTFSGTIYTFGASYNGRTLTKSDSEEANDTEYFTSSISELTKDMDYITHTDYPTASSRAAALGHQFYLKHDILNDEIINSYVCFISDSEHCMKGGDNGASFAINTGIIQDYQAYYNLNTVSSLENYAIGCLYANSYSSCYSGVESISAETDGTIELMGSDYVERCEVNTWGSSYCAD